MSKVQTPPAPGRRRQPDLAYFAAAISLAIATVALFLAAVAAWQTARIPFPGLFTEPTLVVNGQGDSSWPGYAAGLCFPQRLVALDGQPLDNPQALIQRLATHRIGETVALKVRDTETGTEREVQVQLTSLPFSALRDFFLAPYLVAVLYLLAGVWVFRIRGHDEVGQVFIILCALVALVLGLIFDLYTTHYLFALWVVVIPVVGGAAIHMASIFPQRLRILQRRSMLRLLIHLPGLAWALIGLKTTLDWNTPTAYFGPWNGGRAWAGMGAVLMVGMMIYLRYLSRSPIVQAQARTILWGVLLSFTPVVAWIPLAFQLGFPFYPLLLLPPFALFPLSIAYTLLRHRTLHIDWVVRRAATYVLLAVVALGAYLLLLAVGQALQLSVDPLQPAVLVLFALLVALGSQPVRVVIQRTVDRALLGRRITPEQALQGFAQDTAAARTREEATAAVANVLGKTLAPRYALLYLLDKRTGQHVPRELYGTAPEPVQFQADGALAQRMASDPRPLYLAAESGLPPELEAENKRLAFLGPALFVPLPRHGWLTVGPTRPRRFRATDVWFLEALAPQIVATLERVRLSSDLERRLTELEALRLIAQSVGYTVELDDLLELIHTQTGRILDAANFYVALHDPEPHTLRFAFYVEDGERLYPDDVWPDTQGLTGIIVRTGQPIITDDYIAECQRREVPPGRQPGGQPGRAWMGMPLLSRDQILGVMNVSSSDPAVVYTQEQAEVFRAIADQAATILDKSRLYGEMERRARQLEALNEVGSVITSTLELDRVLDLIMQKAIVLLQAEAGSLLLVDEETGELVFQVTSGPRTADLVGRRLPMGTGIVGQVAQEVHPITVDDVQQDGRWYSGMDEQSDFVTRSVICVPLVARGEVIGVIELLNRQDGNPFDVDDRQLLTAFASHAAVAIENARLFTMTDQALAARVEELSMMQRIDRELNATLDYRRVMEITLDWAIRTTGADIGLVAIVVETEEGKSGLRFLAHQGYPEGLPGLHEEELWPLERGLVGRAVRTGKFELVEDVTRDADYEPIVPGIVTQLTVPIRREEQVTGAIVLESSQKGQLEQDALDFVVRLTDHAAIAIENARLFKAVQAANDAKTEFISFVSHELKQPMTSIRGYTDLLIKGTAGALSEMQQSFLEVIRSNAGRMDTLVQELLDISRIEAGRLRLEIDQVAMGEVIEEATQMMRREVEAKEHALEVQIRGSLPPVVADRTRLLQVLANLISNACKYTPEKGHIRVFAELADGSFVRCSVSDTGIGVTQEEQELLFTKYFRSRNPAVRSVPGTGLGLAITKSLVELQGGEMWVESKAGKGSTFAFTIPAAAD